MAEDDEPDDPARAFKDMAAEVAVLRRAVEAFGEQLERVKPRNYDPTLGEMRGELQAGNKRLDRIEASPGMKITPDAFAREMNAAVERVAREMGGKLEIARQGLADTTKQLRGYIAQAATAEQQARSQLRYAGAGVLAGVVLLWALTMVVGVLPAGWHMREKLAAGIIGQDRWSAAESLARSVDPTRWSGLEEIASILKPSGRTIQRCRAAADTSGHSERCVINVVPSR